MVDSVNHPTVNSPIISPPESSSPGSVLGQEEFFQIMISELINQDPLEPMDNTQFLNQLVQTQTLQSTTKLADGIEALRLGQQISAGSSMLGAQVTGVLPNGENVTGVVTSVQLKSGEVSLGIGDNFVPLESVTQILGAVEEVTEEDTEQA